MTAILLAGLAAGCGPRVYVVPAGQYTTVQACSNCPTSTVYRGPRGLVCEDWETHCWKRCGRYIEVLVPKR